MMSDNLTECSNNWNITVLGKLWYEDMIVGKKVMVVVVKNLFMCSSRARLLEANSYSKLKPHLGSAPVWMPVFPQNWQVKILAPRVMVLGGGVFGRWLGRECGALVNWKGAPINRPERACLPLCAVWLPWEGHLWMRKQAFIRHGTWPCWQSDLTLPATRTVRITFPLLTRKFLLFISQP